MVVHRTCQLNIRISELDKQMLRDRAKQKNLTVSRYVRSVADLENANLIDRRKAIEGCCRKLARCLIRLQTELADQPTAAKLLNEAIESASLIEQEVNS